MPINMKGCGASGNKGDGVRVVGDVNLNLDNFQSNNNEGHGYNFITVEALVAQLGLPKESDPQMIKDVLERLLAERDLEPREVIENSGLFATITAAGADISTIAANFSSILANPSLQDYLRILG